MKRSIKRKYIPGISLSLNTYRKKEIIKSLFLSMFLSITALSCSKSSAPVAVIPPPPICTTGFCKLTSHKWTIKSEVIGTNIGNYTYQTEQLSTIPWATFLFRTDSTYTIYTGYTNKYSYADAAKTLILNQDNLSLHFGIDSLAQFFLKLDGLRLQMHPRTDYSPEASYAISAVAGSLHNDFGVDTSAIKYIQPVFTYVY
ncbi:MAG: hypothetical protein ABJA90_07640 [Ginsengibacter sp.]